MLRPRPPSLHAASRSWTLLAALCLALLPATPVPAQSPCAACDLALRDCRAQCTAECRSLKPDVRQSCRQTCQSTRDRTWAACSATHAACATHCAQATDPACPKACLTALRQERSDGRAGRKGCLESCRAQARSARATCRLQDPQARGDCLSEAGQTQATCLRGCAAGDAAGTDTRISTTQQCMAECAGS